MTERRSSRAGCDLHSRPAGKIWRRLASSSRAASRGRRRRVRTTSRSTRLGQHSRQPGSRRRKLIAVCARGSPSSRRQHRGSAARSDARSASLKPVVPTRTTAGPRSVSMRRTSRGSRAAATHDLIAQPMDEFDAERHLAAPASIIAMVLDHLEDAIYRWCGCFCRPGGHPRKAPALGSGRDGEEV
jgi:hypothetical protein